MKSQSPLFFPVLWEGSHFKILDETLLPWKIEYITAREIPEALRAVKEMRTRAFGQVLTFIYAAALAAQGYQGKDPQRLRERLNRLAEEFTEARPTFDFKGLAGSFTEWFRELPPGEGPGRWIVAKALEFASAIRKAREARARRVAELLPGPCRLLTHCNISGELVEVARRCQEMGKEISVMATETRPYLQGSRLTAWEAARAGLRVSLIPDSAIAQVMAKGEIDAVLVGSDRCAQNGDIVNKVGTYPLALAAREHAVPFYALVQEPGQIARGEEVAIEERPLAELFAFQGKSYAPEGLQGRYPAFDVTPASLISRLIGFDGVFTPESFREKYLKTSPPAQDGKKEREKYLLVYGIPQQNSYSYLRHALKAEKCSSLLIPEMRPELWGVHVVARQLLERKIPTTLISDNMMGTLFAQGQIRRLCLFYTELGEKGPGGICGSLLAALLARAHKVPVELLAAERIERSGVEDRDVSTFMGQRVSPEGVAIYPVERELIPWPLLKEKEARS